MIAWPSDSETVTRLQELQRQELTAVINGDRATMVLCRLMWTDLYRRATMREVVAATPHSEVAEQRIRDVNDPEPYWRKLQKARPLRLVVKREQYRLKLYETEPTTAVWYRELLDCGHQVNLPADLFGGQPPKRRRCMQCATRIMEEKNGNRNLPKPRGATLATAIQNLERNSRSCNGTALARASGDGY